MNVLQNRQISTLTIAILAALKIILQAFGLNIITNTEMNQIADGIAALCTVIGVVMTHMKHSPASSQAPKGSNQATQIGETQSTPVQANTYGTSISSTQPSTFVSPTQTTSVPMSAGSIMDPQKPVVSEYSKPPETSEPSYAPEAASDGKAVLRHRRSN